jgi:predicted ATP-grasp superfamily ATP-dependent carboligase
VASLAYVLGDVDLVQAHALAGIGSVVVTPPDDPARFSRHALGWVPWVDHWEQPERLVAALLDSAAQLPDRPVLCHGSDGDLLAVSRHRTALQERFRVSLADAALVEALVDKGRFAALAQRLGLPVPRTVVLDPDAPDAAAAEDLRLPVVVKPWTREGLQRLRTAAKAVQVQDRSELRRRAREAGALGVGLVVQELVAGAESAIESWHAYVDDSGRVLGSFTGAKTRTQPQEFGHSSVLVTTEASDVAALGRDVVHRTGLRGLVKVDVKRDPDGALWLLEVNPRYTLWHHLGAVAGVNLAELAHRDLRGELPGPVPRAQPGLVWCDPIRDLRGVVAGEVSPARWLRTTLTCAARSGADHGDAAPLLRGRVWRALRHRQAAA